MPKKKSQRFDSAKFLLKISAGKTVVRYPKDSEIFSQGRPADAVFYIQKGRVKLSVVSEEGKEAIIGIIHEGDFIGIGSIAGRLLNLTTATAIGDCVLLRIEKRAMLQVLRDQSDFSEFFMLNLLSRTARYEEALVHRFFDTSERRLARILLLLARVGKGDKPATILPRVNHEALAQMVGTTRARVSHFMNKFKKLGLVDYNGEVQVRDALIHVVLHE